MSRYVVVHLSLDGNVRPTVTAERSPVAGLERGHFY